MLPPKDTDWLNDPKTISIYSVYKRCTSDLEHTETGRESTKVFHGIKLEVK